MRRVLVVEQEKEGGRWRQLLSIMAGVGPGRRSALRRREAAPLRKWDAHSRPRPTFRPLKFSLCPEFRPHRLQLGLEPGRRREGRIRTERLPRANPRGKPHHKGVVYRRSGEDGLPQAPARAPSSADGHRSRPKRKQVLAVLQGDPALSAVQTGIELTERANRAQYSSNLMLPSPPSILHRRRPIDTASLPVPGYRSIRPRPAGSSRPSPASKYLPDVANSDTMGSWSSPVTTAVSSRSSTSTRGRS